MSTAEKIELYQRSANLGQVYGIASALRTFAEEAGSLSGLCLEQKHTDALGSVAKQADEICGQIMSEWDRIKKQLAEGERDV